jgi:hypothetical protein
MKIVGITFLLAALAVALLSAWPLAAAFGVFGALCLLAAKYRN